MPGMMFEETPCQAIVQPPAWFPMLSALGGNHMIAGRLSSGAPPAFLSSTCDAAAARRASARLGGCRPCRHRTAWRRMLEQPELELRSQDPRYRVVDARHADPAGCFTKSSSVSNCAALNGSMNMSVPALTPVRTL